MTMNENVSPIENGDFLASYVTLPEGKDQDKKIVVDFLVKKINIAWTLWAFDAKGFLLISTTIAGPTRRE